MKAETGARKNKARHRLARPFLEQDKLTQAEDHIRNLVEQHPESIKYQTTLGEVCLHQGKTDQATQAFENIPNGDRAMGIRSWFN